MDFSFLRRPQFETERTYVPEQGVVNKRLGMPMEELNQSSSVIVSTASPQIRNGGSHFQENDQIQNNCGQPAKLSHSFS